MSGENQPAFRVYSVIPREGKDDFWLNIGLAFPHQDGKGFNVMLQALPLNAKLVLREAAEEAKQPTTPAPQNEQPAQQPKRSMFGRSGARG